MDTTSSNLQAHKVLLWYLNKCGKLPTPSHTHTPTPTTYHTWKYIAQCSQGSDCKYKSEVDQEHSTKV